jgi:hypothetical protein
MPYVNHPQHRSAAFAGQKSQWTIAIPDEQSCYQASVAKNWQYSNYFWGLHVNGTTPSVLGTSPQPNPDQLHIAKFVGDTQGNWHGYPVAPWLSPFDKPHESVLKLWLIGGLIKKQAFSKIHRGKKCAL